LQGSDLRLVYFERYFAKSLVNSGDDKRESGQERYVEQDDLATMRGTLRVTRAPGCWFS